MYRHTFTVEGMVRFPVDMLRYDGAFPATESDSAVIDQSIGVPGIITREKGPFKVTLHAVHESKSWVPTLGRWKSFLWDVTGGPAPQKI